MLDDPPSALAASLQLSGPEPYFELQASPAWEAILTRTTVSAVSRRALGVSCALLGAEEEVAYLSRSVELGGLDVMAEECVVQLVTRAAASPTVLRVLVSSVQRTQNFEVRGLIQSGSVGFVPYHDAGLTGTNQVVGIVDSGLNDLSCFLVDSSNAYASINTDRSGTLQSLRRKVIKYTSSADSLDYLGGHGTHVASIIAGSSITGMKKMSGMAPDAKIVFLDAGSFESRDCCWTD